jgi:hypothetical protein
VHGNDGSVLEQLESDVLNILRPEDPAMLHENFRLIVDVTWMVAAGFVGGMLALRYRIPVLIGYLVAGEPQASIKIFF